MMDQLLEKYAKCLAISHNAPVGNSSKCPSGELCIVFSEYYIFLRRTDGTDTVLDSAGADRGED